MVKKRRFFSARHHECDNAKEKNVFFFASLNDVVPEIETDLFAILKKGALLALFEFNWKDEKAIFIFTANFSHLSLF